MVISGGWAGATASSNDANCWRATPILSAAACVRPWVAEPDWRWRTVAARVAARRDLAEVLAEGHRAEDLVARQPSQQCVEEGGGRVPPRRRLDRHAAQVARNAFSKWTNDRPASNCSPRT